MRAALEDVQTRPRHQPSDRAGLMDADVPVVTTDQHQAWNVDAAKPIS